MRLLEVCVEDAAGMQAAVAGGADRLELCSNLGIGGVTPSAGLMAEAARLPIPVIALIRPRAGDFVYSAAEERVMLRDIELAAELGLAGVAIGALTRGARLDRAMIQRLAGRARGLQLTLHRAFDLVPDPTAGLEEAIAMGFHRVLTSGGVPQAIHGAAKLAGLVRQSRERISVLAGGGIRPGNVADLMNATGVHEVHASCRVAVGGPAGDLASFGFADPTSRVTSADVVRELKASMQGCQGVSSSRN